MSLYDIYDAFEGILFENDLLKRSSVQTSQTPKIQRPWRPEVQTPHQPKVQTPQQPEPEVRTPRDAEVDVSYIEKFMDMKPHVGKVLVTEYIDGLKLKESEVSRSTPLCKVSKRGNLIVTRVNDKLILPVEEYFPVGHYSSVDSSVTIEYTYKREDDLPEEATHQVRCRRFLAYFFQMNVSQDDAPAMVSQFFDTEDTVIYRCVSYDAIRRMCSSHFFNIPHRHCGPEGRNTNKMERIQSLKALFV